MKKKKAEKENCVKDDEDLPLSFVKQPKHAWFCNNKITPQALDKASTIKITTEKHV